VVTLAMLGGGIGAYGLAPSLPIALAVLVVAGAGYLSSNTHVTTNLQLRVDDAQRGRIMALWSICFLGSRPIASLVDGALASSAGVRAAVVALALPAAVSALLVASAARRPAA
jgi:hypothetical protein